VHRHRLGDDAVAELGLVRRGIPGWPEVKPAQEPAGALLDRSPEAEDLGALVPAQPVPDRVGDRVTVDGFAVLNEFADRRVAVKTSMPQGPTVPRVGPFQAPDFRVEKLQRN